MEAATASRQSAVKAAASSSEPLCSSFSMSSTHLIRTAMASTRRRAANHSEIPLA